MHFHCCQVSGFVLTILTKWWRLRITQLCGQLQKHCLLLLLPKTLSFGFAWDSMHSFSLPLQYVVTVMNLPPTPLLHLCRSGNIINQYINKQLGRPISENAHTNTHIHKHILHGWCIVTDLERSPGQTRSHRPCGTAGQPSSEAPNWGTTHTSTSPLFLEKKKPHYGSWRIYTHLYTNTHTVTLECRHILYHV